MGQHICAPDKLRIVQLPFAVAQGKAQSVHKAEQSLVFDQRAINLALHHCFALVAHLHLLFWLWRSNRQFNSDAHSGAG
jgi:hypothetical protein